MTNPFRRKKPKSKRVPLPTFDAYKDSISIWEMVLVWTGVLVVLWAIAGRPGW